MCSHTLLQYFMNISCILSICTFMDSRFKVQGFSDKNEAKKSKERVKKLVTSILKEQEDCTIQNQPVQKKKPVKMTKSMVYF
ncbi:unnamed protein product [Diabrotica balteata]|uniref:Uncharacterized protein n=1 Tax=Diabrotica balteata TaxID=107213 RepID=A0A9N9SNV2_DIABA|nr:unnamed protein product [Diabrotica balteata]